MTVKECIAALDQQGKDLQAQGRMKRRQAEILLAEAQVLDIEGIHLQNMAAAWGDK